MATYMKEMDAPDVGDYLTFFAYCSDRDESRWFWRYGLTLTSTFYTGSMGKAGDGIDFILDEGELNVIDVYDAERELSDFADDHLPSVPVEILDEFTDDQDLNDMAELSRSNPEMSFRELYVEVTGWDPDDPYIDENTDRLANYARANGWDFSF